MAQQLSCFYFPYFVVPDELLKLGVLYCDKIYVDKLSDETLNIAFQHLVKEGPLAKYAFGQVRAIERALEAYETQMAAWRTAGLWDSGIIVPSGYHERLDSLPYELMKKLLEQDSRLVYLLPEDVTAWLIKRKLKVWHMAGTYHWLQGEAQDWENHMPSISLHDERMPVEIEEEFRDLKVPDEIFNYRSKPLIEGKNAGKIVVLRSVQKYGPNNCFMPAYLLLLVEGVVPWMADPTAEKLLTYHFPRYINQFAGDINHSLTSDIAIKALRFSLPSLSFRPYEDVLEAHYL